MFVRFEASTALLSSNIICWFLTMKKCHLFQTFRKDVLSSSSRVGT